MNVELGRGYDFTQHSKLKIHNLRFSAVGDGGDGAVVRLRWMGCKKWAVFCECFGVLFCKMWLDVKPRVWYSVEGYPN